jgi:hypothetical protein
VFGEDRIRNMTAIKMKADGMPLEVIIKYTELSREEN